MKYIIILLAVLSFLTLKPTPLLAHQSGCHRWHSCPSDSGIYTCGDTGYSNYCGSYYSTPTPVPTWTYKGATYYTFNSANQAFWKDYYQQIDLVYLRLLDRSSTEKERKLWSQGVSFNTGYNINRIVNYILASKEYHSKTTPTPTETTSVLGTSEQPDEEDWGLWVMLIGAFGGVWLIRKLNKS